MIKGILTGEKLVQSLANQSESWNKQHAEGPYGVRSPVFGQR